MSMSMCGCMSIELRVDRSIKDQMDDKKKEVGTAAVLGRGST